MTPIQIIMLIGGILLIASYFINFKRIFSNMSDNTAPENTKPDVENIKPDFVIEDKVKLSEIVKHWELLKNMCESNGLKEAKIKLEEVFPLLVKKE